MTFVCTKCSTASKNIDMKELKGHPFHQFHGTLHVSATHANACIFFAKARLTLKYMAILRKYFEAQKFDSNAWLSNIGFLVERNLLVLDHIMVSKTTDNLFFPTNFHCACVCRHTNIRTSVHSLTVKI